MNNKLNDTKQNIENFTDYLISELSNAGTIVSIPHIIIQNVVSKDPEQIEKVATQAIKLGFDVEDPESFEDDLLKCDLYYADENMTEEEAQEVVLKGEYYSLDICIEVPNLDRDLIIDQSLKIAKIAEELHCIYTGWGSFVEDGSEEDDSEEIFYDYN